MNPALAQREIALAGIALLALVAVVAVTTAGRSQNDPGSASGRSPATGWSRAVAAPYDFPTEPEQTACGHPANASTLGVAHPVLPCGAKITILFGDRQILTQVVDRGPGVPGREFDITAPLAREIGLTGIQPILWRFAQADP